jgi:ADP-ribose pyrophosphatase
MAPAAWKTRSSREVYKNPWIRVREDVAELPQGGTTIYGVVEMANAAVGVLPFVDENHVMLVRQYRYVFGEAERWEIPTGGAKPGELLEEAAQRELQEEIGYTARRLEKVSTLYTSKSVVHEVAHLYLGYSLEQGELPPDATEELEKAIFPFVQALEMVNTSEIRDAMTIVAILQAARLRAQAGKQ